MWHIILLHLVFQMVSTLGAVFLAVLPVLILNIGEEVEFIKDNYHRQTNSPISSVSPDHQKFTLNFTIASLVSCEEYSATFKKFLNAYMVGHVSSGSVKIAGLDFYR